MSTGGNFTFSKELLGTLLVRSLKSLSNPNQSKNESEKNAIVKIHISPTRCHMINKSNGVYYSLRALFLAKIFSIEIAK